MYKDIIGQKFGRLLVQRRLENTHTGAARFECLCDCGNTTRATGVNLRYGNTQSCGCLQKDRTFEEQRTEENKVRFDDDTAIITTNNPNPTEFTIDKEDYNKVKDYRWFTGPHDYIVANSLVARDKKVYLHRLLLHTDSAHIDHKDTDKNNNKKDNLRPATHSQNFGNQMKRQTYRGKPTSSKYKGVSFCRDRRTNQWRAQVSLNYENVFVGYFETEVEAARAYNHYAAITFREFARLNEIEEDIVVVER